MKSFLHFFVITIIVALSNNCLSPWLEAQNRTMQNITLHKKTSTSISFATRSFQWYDGLLYCVNYEKQSVEAIFPQTGATKQEFGRKGTKEGEFQGISFIYVSNDRLICIDIEANTITEFDHSGNVKKIYKQPEKTGQLLSAIPLRSPSLYLTKRLEAFEKNKEVFHVVNISNKTTDSIYASPQEIPPDVEGIFASFIQPKIHSLYFWGPMVSNNNGFIFRVSSYCGEFIAFDDKSGRILYGRKTIDSYASKETKKSAKIPATFQNMREINLSAAANTRYLFVLSNAPSSSIKDIEPNFTDERIVDVYNVANGDYAFSFILPQHNNKRALRLAMNEQALWVLYDREIVQYDYHIP
jgi:hypothetical protein